MKKKYNTPHRSHVVKTRMNDEEYDIYQIASTIAEVMTNSFDKPFGIDSFIGISGQIKKQYDILNKLKGDSVHVVDMRECFDAFADKQVEITLKNGKVFIGVLEDWTSALDFENIRRMNRNNEER